MAVHCFEAVTEASVLPFIRCERDHRHGKEAIGYVAMDATPRRVGD